MTDQGSPPGPGSLLPSTSGSPTSEDPVIVIQQQPPPYLYIVEQFSIRFDIMRARIGEYSPLKVVASVVSPDNGAALTVEGPTADLKAVEFKCRIHVNAVPTTGTGIRIRLTSTEASLAPAESNQIQMVNAKLNGAI